MALSNWDTLAIDEKGKSCNGVMEYQGWTIELYKNWAYVRTPKEVEGNKSFTNKTIAQVNDGSCQIGPFDIVAKRGPQAAIFLLVTVFDWNEEKKKGTYKYFAGIGCYGFKSIEDKLIEIGYDMSKYNPDDCWSEVSCSNEDGGWDKYLDNWDTKERIPIPDESIEVAWVGVKPDTYKQFLDFLKPDKYSSDEYIKWHKKVLKLNPKRFNQGDMFFALNAGTPLNATKIGKSKKTTMSKIIKEMK